MINSNEQKKREIDRVMTDYLGKVAILKKKRDVIVNSLLAVLKERKINEIMQSIK